jgi:heme/copper-type cytochrome/quinol oxidase subunit 2
MTKQCLENVCRGRGGVISYHIFSIMQTIKVSFKLESLHQRDISGARWVRNLDTELVWILWQTLYLCIMHTYTFVTIKYTSDISLTQN